MASILLIDDDADLTHYLELELEGHGHQVKCLDRAANGPEFLAQGNFDLVLLDNKMPGISGIEFLKALQQRGLGIPVILMTGHATTDTAIQAMNFGAFDYVIKPLEYGPLVDELVPLIDKALEIGPLKEAVRVPGEEAVGDSSATMMLGNSRPMQEVYKVIGRVANSDAPVLIQGETGTGKELVARAIHANSPRRNKPFVAMNCTAFNENLLDDELFGHEPGAFTGAEKLRKGRFEYAHGGTFFLDEVGDMPPTLQAKLLRVLESQEVQRIGSNESLRINVRVLSATHRHLDVSVREGKFREDLYHRLAGVTIRLPPLRERGNDILVLAEHTLLKVGQSLGQPMPVLLPSAREKLLNWTWPGNVRQLQNVVRRASLMCRGGQIQPTDLELGSPDSAGAMPGRPTLSEDAARAALHQAVRWAIATGKPDLFAMLCDMMERELLHESLAEWQGNQAQIAKRLGIARSTLIEKIRKHNLK